MATFRKIGVLTSGGDAPGMNAIIRAVVRKATEEGMEAVGILGGFSGLIHKNLIPLTARSVSNIISNSGTMLYSDRCPEFKTEEGMQKAIATCREAQIDAIVAVGGDGTFRGCHRPDQPRSPHGGHSRHDRQRYHRDRLYHRL